MDAVASAASPLVVRAAGGVPWRHLGGGLAGSGLIGGGLAGPVEVALVHRPRYDDWTLPKGKLHRGEHPIVAACREVREETGVGVCAGTRLPSVAYPVPVGGRMVDKVVDFWAMAAVEDAGFTPSRETDALSWLGVPAARSRLSYPRDTVVLDAFAALVVLAPSLLLVAGGSGGARKLAAVLACYAPTRLVGAPDRRCVQTLRPLADAVGTGVEVDAALAAEAAAGQGAQLLRTLAAGSAAGAVGPTVACVEADTADRVMAALAGESAILAGSGPARAGGRYGWAAASGWALSFANGALVAADPIT